MLEAAQISTKKIHNDHKYIRYKDLRDKEGEVTAKLILEQKKELQKALETEDPETGLILPWVSPHPDLPGNEDRHVNRNLVSSRVELYFLGLW